MRDVRAVGRWRSGSMPAVGTRKSTRAFVAKAAAAAAAAAEDEPVALRSGKRLVLSKPPGKKVEAGGCGDDWIRLLDGGSPWWEEADGVNRKERVTVSNDAGGRGGGDGVVGRDNSMGNYEKGMGSPVKRFGCAYNRKRKRLPVDGAGPSSPGFGNENDENCRYGVAYVRRKDAKRHRLPDLESAGPEGLRLAEKDALVERGGVEGGLEIAASARRYAEEHGMLGSDLWCGGGGRRVALVVLVDSSVTDSVCRFSRFFVSVLSGMRKKSLNLHNFACFLLSKEIGSAFSLHGIHFLPVQFDHCFCLENTQVRGGLCVISGSLALVPLVSVNFSALPLYFKRLHTGMSLRSRFLCIPPMSNHQRKPCRGKRKTVVQNVSVGNTVGDVHETVVLPAMSNSISTPVQSVSIHLADSVMELAISQSPVVSDVGISVNDANRCDKFASNGGVRHVKDPRSASRGVATRRSMITRSQRRRTSLRSARRRTTPNPNRNFSGIFVRQKAKPAVNSSSSSQNAMDFDVSTNAKNDLSLTLANVIPKKPSPRSSDDRAKELKSLETEIKQNIESKMCKASILVIAADRCWREEGAEVMMESSDPGDWYLSVKVNGLVKYMHKPQEMRSSVTNRYSHSMIWTGESSWKLEFDDRRDWFIFKHLHRECLERNFPEASAISIPVPGVKVISDYESQGQGTFVRPDEYIRTKGTEIERVLASETTYYDLDIGDEEWLKQFNCSAPQEGVSAVQLPQEGGRAAQLSEDNFERIMYSFEKAAYNNPDGVLNQETATGLCLDLTDKETVAAVFGYWLKKKKNKRIPLVRFLQEYPLQKMHVTQGPFLRKKRSFKRQGSNVGRGKPAFYLQAGVKQEEMRKVREAEAAALKAEEVAIKLRSKAQMLMSNADLLTYKSVMALRLAEAIRNSESPDVLYSIL